MYVCTAHNPYMRTPPHPTRMHTHLKHKANANHSHHHHKTSKIIQFSNVIDTTSTPTPLRKPTTDFTSPSCSTRDISSLSSAPSAILSCDVMARWPLVRGRIRLFSLEQTFFVLACLLLCFCVCMRATTVWDDVAVSISFATCAFFWSHTHTLAHTHTLTHSHTHVPPRSPPHTYYPKCPPTPPLHVRSSLQCAR